jgi:hypothetical protein
MPSDNKLFHGYKDGSTTAGSMRSSVAAIADTLEAAEAFSDEQLFDLVDKDKSGTISRDEFGKLIQVVRMNVSSKQRQESEAERQARRIRFMRISIGMIMLLLMVILLGNMGLSYAVYKLSKDTSIGSSRNVANDEGNDHVVMTDRYKHTIQTGLALKTVSEDELDHAADSDLPQRLKGTRYMTDGGEFRYATTKWWAFNGANVSIYELWDGSRMASSSAGASGDAASDSDFALLEPPTGVVMPSDSSALADVCSMRGCTAAGACVGLRSSVTRYQQPTTSVLHSVRCAGAEIWSWPSPSRPAHEGVADLTIAEAMSSYQVPHPQVSYPPPQMTATLVTFRSD